ncbi:MAG TPA: hypothetical protein VGN42_08715, partial [Pirellulales bacterium]|nr:hypothetical protein [Pirellulales bacterium]
MDKARVVALLRSPGDRVSRSFTVCPPYFPSRSLPMKARWFFTVALVAILSAPLAAADAKNKRLLLVTDSGGFVHDSVGLAEEVLKDIGPKNGFDVTCYRFTREPKEDVLAKYSKDFRSRTGLPVEKENCGRINKETLKNFDLVLFFTTGNPL